MNVVRRTCVTCGKSFKALTSTTCCSIECSQARDLERARKYGRERYAANPEKTRVYQRKRRAKNPEKVRKVERKYRATHAKRVSEVSRRYAAAHPERMREAERTYGATDRGRAAQAAARSNRRTKLSGILLTADVVLDLKSEYAGFCPYCGCRITKGQVDHIVPVSKGGTNERNNLAWVCKSCNLQKHDKSLLTFLLQCQEANGSLKP